MTASLVHLGPRGVGVASHEAPGNGPLLWGSIPHPIAYPMAPRSTCGQRALALRDSRGGDMALFDLKGRVAVVTGGNGGIGLGMARGLAQAGAAVALPPPKPKKGETPAPRPPQLRAQNPGPPLPVSGPGPMPQKGGPPRAPPRPPPP